MNLKTNFYYLRNVKLNLAPSPIVSQEGKNRPRLKLSLAYDEEHSAVF